LPDYEKRFRQMLEASGAVLIRSKNHRVYRLPNNRQLTIAQTPSDHASWANMISHLRKQLGLQPVPKQEQPTEPKVKRRKEKTSHALPIGLRHGDVESVSPHGFGTKMQMALGLYHGPQEIIRPAKPKVLIYKPPRKARHEPTERHGRVVSLSADIIKKSNEILLMGGEAAQREYLEEQLERLKHPEKFGEETEDDTVMSFKEVVASAKQQLASIDSEIAALQKGIDEAGKAIAAKETQRNKLKDFVENAEVTLMALDEAETSLRAAGIHLGAASIPTSNKSGVTKKARNINPYGLGITEVIDKIMPLFEANPDKSFRANDIHEWVMNDIAGGLKELPKKFIWDALGYETRKPRGRRLQRVGIGLYQYLPETKEQAA
jgi:hypothetical protein